MPIARKQLSNEEEPYELIYIDDQPISSFCNGHSVMSYSQWISRPATSRHVNIAIADCKIRQSLAARCQRDGVDFFEIRANDVSEFDDVIIGEGAVLCSRVSLTSNIRIGQHFHANLLSYIEHDCIIGNFVTFAPGVKCNGNVIIEDCAYIGAGAIIRQGTRTHPLVIGANSVVGMGAVVTRSVPAGTTVVGNPAKPLDRI